VEPFAGRGVDVTCTEMYHCVSLLIADTGLSTVGTSLASCGTVRFYLSPSHSFQ